MITGGYPNGLDDGAAVYPEWLYNSYPNSSYTLIQGSSDLNYNGYWGVKYFNFYFNVSEPFEYGKTYALELDFSYGSYITWTNFYNWDNMIPDRTLFSCNNGSIDNLAQCSIQWNPTNDTSSSTMTLLYRPDITSTFLGISVGSQNNGRFVFWNRFGEPQGFKVNQVRITSTQNSGGTPQQDFTAVIEELESNGRKLDELNDNINSIGSDLIDDTAPSDSEISNFLDELPLISFGPVSTLVQIPIRILQDINTISENSSCSSINLGSLYGTNLILPCIDIDDYIGTSLYTIIDIIFFIFIIYNTFMLIVSFVESWTSLEDSFNSLYQPKHAYSGYKPKHGGGN